MTDTIELRAAHAPIVYLPFGEEQAQVTEEREGHHRIRLPKNTSYVILQVPKSE